MTIPHTSAIYGVIEIHKPSKKKNLFPKQIKPVQRLIGVGINIIVDLHAYCHVDAEFDLSPGEEQLRVYRSSTGRQLYQAKVTHQDDEPVIKVEPLTTLAVHYLHQLGSFSYLMGVDE